MNTLAKVLIGAAALSALAPSAMHAQVVRDPARIGVQVNYGNDSKFGLGVRVRHSLRSLFPSTPLSGIGSFDVFFPGRGITWFDFNYNVAAGHGGPSDIAQTASPPTTNKDWIRDDVEKVIGGAGNDTFRLRTNVAMTFVGGAGNDQITVDPTVTAAVTSAAFVSSEKPTFWRMMARVRRLRRIRYGRRVRSSAISATSAVSIAVSLPAAPITIPTSAAARAGASLMPSPTMPTVPNRFW